MSTAAPNRQRRGKVFHNATTFAVCLFLALLCVAVGTVLALQRGLRSAGDTAKPSVGSTQPSFSPSAPPDITLPLFPLAPKPSLDDPLLLLVNRDNPLPEDYAPELTKLKSWDLSVASVMYDELCLMLADGRAQGLRFEICSAYRSRETQQALFDEDVNRYMQQGMRREEAVAATEQYTMLPGCSEHETGLAVDIVASDNQLLDETQAQTAESQWLSAHCWEYGFILRYPAEKSEITGIAHESWHYRYVGKSAAQYLHERELTLEELWEQNG